jgi:hypothetical protein
MADQAAVEIRQIATQLQSLLERASRDDAAAVRAATNRLAGHFDDWADDLRAELEGELARVAAHGTPPSMLRILGRDHLEAPFNRLLAWWADPEADHGLARVFLRALARRVVFPELEEDVVDPSVEIRVHAEEDVDDSGKEPDLIVLTPRAALMVENKVYALESGDQYGPYLALLDRCGEGRTCKAVLAARGVRALPTGWNEVITHADVAAILRTVADDVDARPWARIAALLTAVAFENDDTAQLVARARAALDALGSRREDRRVSPRDLREAQDVATLLARCERTLPWRGAR